MLELLTGKGTESPPSLNENDAKFASLRWWLTMVESTSSDFIARESFGNVTGEETLLVYPTYG